MKKHLVNLLFEEYKQQCLFDELAKKGVELIGICINNLDVIYDIIGFPQENSTNDTKLFSRDILFHKYYEIYKELTIQQKIYVSNKGLQIESGAETETVKKGLLEYIDWLYDKFSQLNYNDGTS